MKSLFLVLSLLSTFAFAQSEESITEADLENALKTELAVKSVGAMSISEITFYPANEKSRFQIMPTLNTFTSQGTSGTNRSTRNLSKMQYDISYEQGFENMAFAFETYVANTKTETIRNGAKNEFKFDGLGDIQLTLKSVAPSTHDNLIYGATVSLSLGEGRYAYRDQTGNHYSGGSSFKPFGIYEAKTTYGSAGGSLSYQFWGPRSESGRAGDSEKQTGGNVLTLQGFTEIDWNAALIGLSTELKMTGAMQYEVTEGFEEFNAESDPQQNLSFSLYGRFMATDSFSVKPVVRYDQLLTKDINGFNYSKSESTSAALALAVVY